MSFSSTFGFKTIFVLANFVLVFAAADVYDDVPFDKVHHLTADQLVPAESPIPMASKFIGDLTIGSERGNNYVYSETITDFNPSANVNITTFYYSIPEGKITYLSVINEVGSYAAVCSYPDSLGSAKTSFSVRVSPKSKMAIRFHLGATL